MPRTALVVEVPEAEPLVADWRAEYDWSAQHGVPAHITLLFPFVPTESLDGRLLRDLEELFGSEAAFSFDLTQVSRFPDVAWLAPEPADQFKALTERIASRYPDYPPYEGIHDEVIPHLTVAEGGAELQDRVEAALAGRLPISCKAREAVLLLEDDAGLWQPGERFPLRG
jgi:2'-5' RNA ligase